MSDVTRPLRGMFMLRHPASRCAGKTGRQCLDRTPLEATVIRSACRTCNVAAAG